MLLWCIEENKVNCLWFIFFVVLLFVYYFWFEFVDFVDFCVGRLKNFNMLLRYYCIKIISRKNLDNLIKFMILIRLMCM